MATNTSSGDSPAPHFERHVPSVEYDILDEIVGYAIRRAQIMINERVEPFFASHDFTTQRFSSLVIVECNPGLNQSRLAEILGVARSGAMALIGFHVERGYVERAPSPLDQRAYGLRITPKGRRVLAKLKPTIRDLEAKAMARLTPLEQQQLFALLEKIGFPSGSGLAGARASATDTP